MRASAEQFLQAASYQDVRFVESIENTKAWHLVYSRWDAKNKAYIYPNSLQIKIAKDDGKIVGLNTMEYIQKEKLPQASVKKINSKVFFADHTIVEDEKLIYMENQFKQLVLCYEWIVVRRDTKGAATYRIVVDANSHEIVAKEKLS